MEATCAGDGAGSIITPKPVSSIVAKFDTIELNNYKTIALIMQLPVWAGR